MKSSKEWSDVVESRFLEDEACGAVLDNLKAVDRTGGKTGEDRVAVVKTGENEGGNEFGGGFSGQIFADETDAANVEEARLGGLRDEFVHR